MEKRKYEKNLAKPRCCRISSELDGVLVILADATGVSPGVFIRIQMEKILEPFKSLVVEQ